MGNAISASGNKNLCHDCHKPMTIENQEIKNGSLCIYEHAGKKLEVFKCSSCFKKNSSLANFQDCEVYSRVVGYLRPVKQWNEGKQEEYSQRQEYCCND